MESNHFRLAGGGNDIHNNTMSSTELWKVKWYYTRFLSAFFFLHMINPRVRLHRAHVGFPSLFGGGVVEKSLEPGLEELLRDGGGCLTNLDYIPEGAASNDERNEKKNPVMYGWSVSSV